MNEYAQQWRQIFADHDLNWEDEWDAEQAAQIFSKEAGLAVVGVGNSRAVFVLDDDRVLKLALGLESADNINECYVWKRTPDDLRSWLAPVLECSSDGSWLVMRRARTPLRREDMMTREQIRDLSIELGIEDLWIPSQWGYLDGRRVIVDYGAAWVEDEVDFKKFKMATSMNRTRRVEIERFVDERQSSGWKAPRRGGLADGRNARNFDFEALVQGVIVELEHTDDQDVALGIAMDHLTEDPDYYVKLAKIENKSLKRKLLR